MTEFKDYFSNHACQYAAARPEYPEPLIDYVASQAPGNALAWDVATGNGQAAVGLARHFQRVHATDASPDQIASARPGAGVSYRTETAEHCSLDNASTDLVTVAQAAHWFDLDGFYAQVRRVLVPGGALAIWCYGIHRVAAEIDDIVAAYYSDTVGPFWPSERRHIDDGYASLPFPFQARATPTFEMRIQWDLDSFVAYLRSWSASQRYLRHHQRDPLEPLLDSLRSAWGGDTRSVIWPIHLKLAIVD
jgi:SAM-dependent methyltransferase